MKRVLLVSLRAGLLAVLALTLTSGVLFAANEDARFALHAKDNFSPTKTISQLCPDLDPSDGINGSYDPNFEGVDCTQYATSRGTNEFPGPHVYLVVGQADISGISGASCGVDYTVGGSTGISETFTTFMSCTDGLEFRNSGANGEFPRPGGGLRITWSSCQLQTINGWGVHAVMGVFYVYAYSPDSLQLTPNNNLDSGIPELAVTACAGGTRNLWDIVDPSLIPLVVGRVDFGGGAGYTPCGVIVPTKNTTWGKLKNLYKEAGE